MQQFIPYLSFNGNCRQAMQFYEQVFGGKLVAMLSYGDMPGDERMPAATAQKIMHAYLTLPDGSSLYAGDALDHEPFQGQQGVMITMTYPTDVAGKHIFQALSEGGSVTMPWAPTFWAKGFGMVKDRFGTAWGINGEQIEMNAQ